MKKKHGNEHTKEVPRLNTHNYDTHMAIPKPIAEPDAVMYIIKDWYRRSNKSAWKRGKLVSAAYGYGDGASGKWKWIYTVELDTPSTRCITAYYEKHIVTEDNFEKYYAELIAKDACEQRHVIKK